jgi:hypothetical protein
MSKILFVYLNDLQNPFGFSLPLPHLVPCLAFEERMAATQTTEDMASGVSQGIPVMLCHTAGNREEVPTRTTSVISNMCIVQPSRKIRPIPPPLDLSKRGPLLDDTSSDDTFSDYIPFSASPRSPLSSNQKHLPFRKRFVVMHL